MSTEVSRGRKSYAGAGSSREQWNEASGEDKGPLVGGSSDPRAVRREHNGEAPGHGPGQHIAAPMTEVGAATVELVYDAQAVAVLAEAFPDCQRRRSSGW